MLPSTSIDCSLKSECSDKRSSRTKTIERPHRIQHFTLNHEEWMRFYDSQNAKVFDNWANLLATYIRRIEITCSVAFKKHSVKKDGSRKKNCNVFSCSGRCTFKECTATFSIIVEEEPKSKTSPAVFTTYVFGNINHGGQKATGSRPLRGVERRVMGMYFAFYNKDFTF